MDGTFYDGSELPERFRAEIPHPTMLDTMARLQTWAAERSAVAGGGAVRFIHLNHSNPAFGTVALAPGFNVARVGDSIEL